MGGQDNLSICLYILCFCLVVVAAEPVINSAGNNPSTTKGLSFLERLNRRVSQKWRNEPCYPPPCGGNEYAARSTAIIMDSSTHEAASAPSVPSEHFGAPHFRSDFPNEEPPAVNQLENDLPKKKKNNRSVVQLPPPPVSIMPIIDPYDDEACCDDDPTKLRQQALTKKELMSDVDVIKYYLYKIHRLESILENHNRWIKQAEYVNGRVRTMVHETEANKASLEEQIVNLKIKRDEIVRRIRREDLSRQLGATRAALQQLEVHSSAPSSNTNNAIDTSISLLSTLASPSSSPPPPASAAEPSADLKELEDQIGQVRSKLNEFSQQNSKLSALSNQFGL